MAKLRPPILSNEKQLQVWLEEKVLPECGLQPLFSARKGKPHLAKIDTAAIADDGAPVIVEYKFPTATYHALRQLARYELRLRDPLRRARFERRCGDRRVDWQKLRFLLIAPRYQKSVVELPGQLNVAFWQVDRPDGRRVYLREVQPSAIATGTVGATFMADTKDSYLPKLLRATTESARLAFIVLNEGILRDGLRGKIMGKNLGPGVAYFKGTKRLVEVVFTSGGLAVRLQPETEDGGGPQRGRISRVSARCHRPTMLSRLWQR